MVRATFDGLNKNVGDPALAWNTLLRDGFMPNSAPGETNASFNVGAVKAYLAAKHPRAVPRRHRRRTISRSCSPSDYKVDDGRYANNGWLQEMPHPISKICWDNAALISPATAKRLGVGNDGFKEGDYSESDLIEIEIPGGRKIKAPVLVSPGHADDSITIALGYGRRRTGRVGRNTGHDAYPLRTAQTTYFATGAKVTATGEKYQLVTTQQHQAMEGRNLIRELPVETYRKNAGFGFEGDRSFVAMMGMDAHMPPNISLYRNPEYGFAAPVGHGD